MNLRPGGTHICIILNDVAFALSGYPVPTAYGRRLITFAPRYRNGPRGGQQVAAAGSRQRSANRRLGTKYFSPLKQSRCFR